MLVQRLIESVKTQLALNFEQDKILQILKQTMDVQEAEQLNSEIKIKLETLKTKYIFLMTQELTEDYL